MLSGRLWELFIDSFPKILLPGLAVTIPLTILLAYIRYKLGIVKVEKED